MRGSLRLVALLLALPRALTAADAPFVAVAGGGGLGLGLGAWAQPLPLAVETVLRSGAATWTRGTYASSKGSVATGTLVSPSGATFLFEDAFSDASAAGFTLSRRVSVLAVGSGDEFAFSTRFSMPAPDALAQARRELFLPGVSYQNASALPSGALAGDPQAAAILVREDRLPLPLALAFFPDAGAGVAARLVHREPDGHTIANEDFTQRIVDAGLRFGSIGFLNEGADFSLAFQYPGSEGNRTYIWNPTDGWANRSHPIGHDVEHTYSLRFEVQGAGSYYVAVRTAWRAEAAAFAPQVSVAPSPAQLYRDGMELLASYVVDYDGVPSVPFEAALPNGHVVDTSSQMGFVGRALPSAALLLYDAIVAAPNITRQRQAEAIVDLWAANALTACGAARTWYNIGDHSLEWRASDSYETSLRIMCDGMNGMVDAIVLLPKPSWLAAASSFGDFLLRAQAPDGSLPTAFDWNCVPRDANTRHTAFAVPFLVALYEVTFDERYRSAALAAGSFSAALFEGCFSYSGGAPDNGDVPDKEAGWLAMQAFVALFELTGNATWLVPAAQAATYVETFLYLWNVPIPCEQSPPTVYPCRRTTLGASIIATGQSSSDNFMSIASFDMQRLGTWLGDAHFVGVGDLLLNATAQMTDWDGSLGYAARGLLGEAFELSVRRGSGVSAWLPWLTANLLQPLVQRQRAAKDEVT